MIEKPRKLRADDSEDQIGYFDAAATEAELHEERIRLAADKLSAQLSQTAGETPIKEKGRFHTLNLPGNEDDPLADWEQLSGEEKQIYLHNRQILEEVIKITESRQKREDYPLDKEPLYQNDLERIARNSGLDDVRIFSDYGDYRKGDRHDLNHTRRSTLHAPVRISGESASRYLETWATIGQQRVFRGKTRYALDVVDLNPLVHFMRQPRTPVEIADALYELLEESSLKVDSLLNERQSSKTRFTHILDKIRTMW